MTLIHTYVIKCSYLGYKAFWSNNHRSYWCSKSFRQADLKSSPRNKDLRSKWLHKTYFGWLRMTKRSRITETESAACTSLSTGTPSAWPPTYTNLISQDHKELHCIRSCSNDCHSLSQHWRCAPHRCETLNHASLLTHRLGLCTLQKHIDHQSCDVIAIMQIIRDFRGNNTWQSDLTRVFDLQWRLKSTLWILC